MKRCALYIIILYIGGLLLSGCHDSLVPPEEQPRAEAERTVIVYISGDNTLSSAVRYDTTEMAKGKDFIPENVNFIIYLDDKPHNPAIYELSAKNGMRLWKQFNEELCSTDSLTMLRTLRSIEHYFPARHYGITFWSHATGWTPRRKTFGKDEMPGTTQGESEMEIPVLRDILAQLPKCDYLFFDACFMQSIEVAYELRNVTQYMIGSPAEIPGSGAPYDKIIDALCRADVRGIVEGYASGYPGTYNGFQYPGVLLSCIDCSQLEPLAQLTGEFLTPLCMNRTERYSDGFQAYCNHLTKYTHYFDMRTTMCRLLSDEAYAAWMEVFDKAVLLHTLSPGNRWFANLCDQPIVWDPECYGGVSMFMPLYRYDSYGWNEDFHKTSWYTAAGWDQTGW
ncbi:MAG: hypothetical protein J6W03_04520 [Bacteroidaceae bacterium]|nr:hypothetical protein [Bacteroidaceae bacterium]